MGINQAVYIEQQMISNGRSPNTPICIIQEGTTSRQRVLTGELKDLSLIIEKHRVKSPGLIVIGEVVRMRSIISWFM
ncbi:siroheme synthase [Anoxybacillus flavithermus]|nr:siroheme synthase [Anoxybacillus flavithermus]